MSEEITRFYNETYLQKIFPTVIGIADYPNIEEIQQDYIKIIESITPICNLGKIYSHEFHKDKRFEKLISWMTVRVNDYAKAHNFPNEYEVFDGWCTDYQKHSYQPTHLHQGHHISTIFYLEAYPEDVPVHFRGPYFNDMVNPFDIGIKENNNSKYFNDLTYPSYWYYPLSGRLLIFRSNVEHYVEPKLNDQRRIVFSFNFDPVRKCRT